MDTCSFSLSDTFGNETPNLSIVISLRRASKIVELEEAPSSPEFPIVTIVFGTMSTWVFFIASANLSVISWIILYSDPPYAFTWASIA